MAFRVEVSEGARRSMRPKCQLVTRVRRDCRLACCCCCCFPTWDFVLDPRALRSVAAERLHSPCSYVDMMRAFDAIVMSKLYVRCHVCSMEIQYQYCMERWNRRFTKMGFDFGRFVSDLHYWNYYKIWKNWKNVKNQPTSTRSWTVGGLQSIIFFQNFTKSCSIDLPMML